jgi:hypothetical protein
VGVRCVYFEVAMSIKDNPQKCDQINITAYVDLTKILTFFSLVLRIVFILL